ncbi:Dam family site-specific DNA-(adenine-N6)-methyltransferase [Helicobacter saguini]|uniref:Site-specific DNA-methyltransferase (adenine-specific) n=2 Tax=Helicobacter saguini TaxID=1548018 RepID=A0A347W6Z5_9HELI|nr:Dam family site-specific DNA-(adenine-N6)-methyltransferase [Helicobacter saguini]MWV66639.1 Dam family site-specific DNA-(adenine-N6)-methyltransferase [Helicobacter saguini]MWV68989.1 Dam family site-specific DNA-(adenine-N6)-methyltransferase [Helicobacter saguini]MWV71457.1 Dam family site-specific DNA-(adenine-N6)-methyltransferase [Helicobacter saguini]TLD94133.1 Dam family site-specific DNA-(adenine-N6)-methyltransferase [Helicobacter saguini]
MKHSTPTISYTQPFIKWAGGKRAILDSMLPFMPKHFNNYFEPFLGGGALFFVIKDSKISNTFLNTTKQIHLQDSKNIESKFFLNDKNTELINAYIIVRDNPNKLLELLKDFQNKHNKEFFYTIRNMDRSNDFKDLDSIFRAARFIYLNKTCFNGLCRYNSKGQFNTPLGSYKNPKIYDKDLILNASFALKNTHISNKDFENLESSITKNDFIYFDPPYYPLSKTSSFVSYIDNFTQDSQIRLFELFKRLDSKGAKVLLSNSNTPFIKDLYKDYEIIELKAKRAINCKGNGRGEISELLIRGNYE